MVLEIPELARENQDWKIYRAHILDSTAMEGVVSHLSGAAPKPVDSHELEAWNVSNAVAKYIILEVITDSLLMRLVHHKLAHTLFSHLTAIFGDHDPIAIELPVEWSHQDEPLCEDSHPKLDGAYSACTTEIPDTPPYAPDGLSSKDRNQETEHCGRECNVHNPDHDTDLSSLPFKPKTTEIHNEKPSGTMPTGILIIPSIHNTNSTLIYPKALGDPPNAPDGTSRGDDHKMAKSGGQRQCTTHEVTRNDETASPAPNLADKTSEMSPFSRKQSKNAVKHQHKSTQYKPQPNRCANSNMQHSNRHPKPTIHLPRRHTLPLEGESVGGATNSYTPSSSGQSMLQEPAHTPNKPDILITISIESEKPRSSEILQVCLECVRWHANDMHHPRSGADALDSHIDRSRGLADDSRGRADVPSTPNKPETANISHGEGAGTYLGPGDAKCSVREMDGVGSHADTLTWLTDIPSIETNTLIPTITPETVSTHLIESKPPNPPIMSANGCANETDRSRNPPRTLDMRTHMITPADEAGNIGTCQNEQKRPNSPS